MICITPFSTRTSGRTICALEPLTPCTKVPVEFVTKLRGSPAAEVVFTKVRFSPNAWISGE